MTEQELDRAINEVWTLFKETDKRIAEIHKETERIIAESSRETDRKIQKMGEKVDALTGKWGRFVEGLVTPAAIRMFKDRGIDINAIHQRVRKQVNGYPMEIDILGMNDEYAVLIEVKSTLGVDDVKDHIERLGKFMEFFPEYRTRKVVGAVAGIVIEGGADRFAYKQGLFIIGQRGDTVAILNDEKFKPTICETDISYR